MRRNIKNFKITFIKKDNEISIIFDKFLKYIISKHNEFKLEFENNEKDYRKINLKN